MSLTRKVWLNTRLHSIHVQSLPLQAGPSTEENKLEMPHSNTMLWLKEKAEQLGAILRTCVKLEDAGKCPTR